SALSGKEWVNEQGEGDKKATVFLRPTSDIVPDKIMIELTPEQAQRCHDALSFGEEGVPNTAAAGAPEGAQALRHGSHVWLVLGFTQFRFLALLLAHYPRK